jgi:hypothetical protein
MQMILDGRRKQHLCDWWLAYIETECDKFLVEHGYNKDCLSDDYMERAPKDLDVVKENLELVHNLMVVTPNSDLDRLIVRVTTEVYTVLDEFIVDTEYVLNTKKTERNALEYLKYRSSLRKDVEYLLKMKAMDEEIQKRRQNGEVETGRKLEMTDVVPIGGLVMARLHVIDCELRTAIEVWSPTTRQLSPPNSHFESPPLQNQLNRSIKFQEFTENATLSSVEIDESKSEFSAFVMATCPSLTPQCCVDVVLRLSESRKGKPPISPTSKHKIRLGHFREETDHHPKVEMKVNTSDLE